VNDRTRIRLAQIAGDRLSLLAKALDAVVDGDTVMGRMRDQQGPLRARSYEPSSRSGRHDAAFAAATHTDQASHDEAELDRRIKHIATEVRVCWEIVARYPAPHRPTEVDRADLARINGRNEPGCQSCARINGEAGGPRWEPIRPEALRPSTVGDRLDQPMFLCTWCYTVTRRWGRLPTPKELERHHRGSIVPWPLDVPRPT
jgi:hypothetical protein